MNGSIFILTETGLYCSNDADLYIHRELIKDDDNKPLLSRHTEKIKVNHFFRIRGEIQPLQTGHCQFKFDDNDEVKTFSMTINSFDDEMIVLDLKALNLRNKDITEIIKNKIKEEINHG